MIDPGLLKRHYNDYKMSLARLRDYQKVSTGRSDRDPVVWAEQSLMELCPSDVIPEPLKRSEKVESYQELIEPEKEDFLRASESKVPGSR